MTEKSNIKNPGYNAKNNNDILFEVRRKILHILCGLFIVLSMQFGIATPFTIFEVLVLLAFLSLISRKIRIPVWSFFIEHFEREEWKESFPGRGLVYFFVGSTLAIYLFPFEVAMASILVLTLGDSVSCIVGSLYKKILNKNNHNKLIVGGISGFFAALIGASLYLKLPEAIVASFAGLIAGFLEMDLNKAPLDDNLAIPLAAGVAVLILRKFVVL